MHNLDGFLRDLTRQAGKDLSPASAQALVTEVRGHLEDSIQARLEPGLSHEEAEDEAIAAFGLPPCVAPPRQHTREQWLMAVFGTIGLLLLIPSSILWAFPVHLRWLVALMVAGYARACWLVRQPTRLTIATTAFASVFVPVMYVVGLSDGGFGHACRNLLYKGPQFTLADLASANPESIWIQYVQGALETAYEQRFAFGTLLLATIGIDFIFGTAGACAAELRRRGRGLRV